MSVFHLKRVLLLFLTAGLISACSEGTVDDTQPPLNYQYVMPETTDDGWVTGHLNDHQLSEHPINQLINNIHNGTHPGVDSLSIVRNGKLLLHENFRKELNHYDDSVGNNELERHVMHSTSKSFVSALVGIASDQGFIPDISTPFYQFFDYAEYQNWDLRKEEMTLENVLTMQLGLKWDEWSHPFGDEKNSLTELTDNNNDFVKALLDLPIVEKPGTTYQYNTVASIALGLLVERATGMPMEDFAQLYLFEPLQIKATDWLMTPTGFPNTGSGLVLMTRDMAKLGQLYLNNGKWNGQQVISENWINRTLNKSVSLDWNYTTGYGYQWWLGDLKYNEQLIPFYSTRGYGGQFIVIIPEFDMVIAFTAQNYTNNLYDSPFTLIEKYILPAII